MNRENIIKILKSDFEFNDKDTKKCSELIIKTKSWWHKDNYCKKCDEHYEVCEYLDECN